MKRNHELIVKTGGKNDCEHVLSIIHTAFAKYEGKFTPGPGALRENVKSLEVLLKKKYTLVTAILEGKIVGCIFYTRKNQDIYFFRLAVLPEYQGMGIAKKLIAFVENAAVEHGCCRVILDVRLSLKKNIRLFTSLGYAITGTGTHEGFKEPTEYKMAKDVG